MCIRDRYLTRARDNCDLRGIAMKQSRCPFPKSFAVCHLLAIGHVEVAMPSNIVYEGVHCGYCWLTDQSDGCLIQVHTLTEAGIIQSIKRRGGHLPMTTCRRASR